MKFGFDISCLYVECIFEPMTLYQINRISMLLATMKAHIAIFTIRRLFLSLCDVR